MNTHMKVAVTGGSGRIGSEVARQLRQRGHEVITLDIRPPADQSQPHVVCDLRVASALRKAFSGCDAVCHLGEWANVYVGPAETYSHNTETGSTVMATAQQAGVPKIIYTSTAQVYGYWGCDITKQPAPAYLPIDEMTPPRAINPYALSKIANEKFAELLTVDGSIDIAAVRIPFTLPLAKAEWVLRHQNSRTSEGIPEGFGTYVLAEDVAKGYCLMLEVGWKGFDVFHFFAEDNVTGDNLLEPIRKIWPNVPLPAGWDGRNPPISMEKTRRQLGWAPEFSIWKLFPELQNPLAKTA